MHFITHTYSTHFKKSICGMKCWVGSNNIVFVAVTLRKLFFEILNRSIKRTGSVELFKRNTLSSTTRLSVLFTWHPSPPPPPSKKKNNKKWKQKQNKNKSRRILHTGTHWAALWVWAKGTFTSTQHYHWSNRCDSEMKNKNTIT